MITSMSRYITVKHLRFIQDICQPLIKRGIVDFAHDITFGHGQLSMLTTLSELFSIYYKEGIPATCTNDSGRYLKPGIYIKKVLEKNYPHYSKITASLFQRFNRTNSIHIVEHEEDCQHFYSFSFNCDEIEFLHWSVNGIPFLTRFVEMYKNKAKEIILEAKKTSNRITLPISPPSEEIILEFDSLKNLDMTDLYIKNEKQLTKRQEECLYQLIKGMTIKQVAKNLNLAPKTVEHYLDTIKNKLNCTSRQELITHALELSFIKEKLYFS